MSGFLTKIVWVCLLWIVLLPILSVLTPLGKLISLSAATLIVIFLVPVCAISAWKRVLYGDKLMYRLPNEVEGARREAQKLIFPETRILGIRAPRVSQKMWDQCADSGRNVAYLLATATVKNVPIFVLLLLGITLEIGVLHFFIDGSEILRRVPYLASPVMRALEISLLCLVVVVILNFYFCRKSALKLTQRG